jgi:hypothetical protein
VINDHYFIHWWTQQPGTFVEALTMNWSSVWKRFYCEGMRQSMEKIAQTISERLAISLFKCEICFVVYDWVGFADWIHLEIAGCDRRFTFRDDRQVLTTR